MSARPMMIYRSGPAFEGKTGEDVETTSTAAANPNTVAVQQANAKGPVIEMTAHPEDGGHFIGWCPATPDGLICAGGEFARLRGYGYRKPPICAIAGQIIPQERIEVSVVVPLCHSEARRRAAVLLCTFGKP